MAMFEELYALALGACLTLTISADEKTGRMTVNVIPKARKNVDESALSQPLSLTATPQEFDAEFIDALRGFREVHQSLAKQAEATKEVIEAARSASVKKASDATSKASKPATTASKAATSAPASKTAQPPSASASGGGQLGFDDGADEADDADGQGQEGAGVAAGGEAGGAVPAAGDSYDLFG